LPLVFSYKSEKSCAEQLLDGIVLAMKRFRGSSDPRYAEIQEQGCRALNAISKGEELIKNYLADRQEELQVMEAIAEAMARCA
jgi:hypothetical protein